MNRVRDNSLFRLGNALAAFAKGSVERGVSQKNGKHVA